MRETKADPYNAKKRRKKKPKRKKLKTTNFGCILCIYLYYIYIYTLNRASLTDISITILTVAWRKEDEEDNAG